jgi:signal transduction histidine kinase
MTIIHADVKHLAEHLATRDFGEAAAALRSSTGPILSSWRRRSIEMIPDLDRLTIVEFENSVPIILEALASALEFRDPGRIVSIVEASPRHGAARFTQRVTPSAMLAEERILRTVIIAELRTALGRSLSDAEAASIHELLDVIGQYSVEALIRLRGQERDAQLLTQVSGMHRLADMGLLVAGLAHDAANLLLPLRSRLDALAAEPLSPGGCDDIEGALLITRQLQDFISNLRMLTVDGRDSPATQPLDLAAWWGRVEPFYRRLLPASIRIVSDVPTGLPGPRITSASLSQVFFNLVRNAEQAMRGMPEGTIRVRAYRSDPEHVEVAVEDDGPGMSPEVLIRCMEPFFSDRVSDSGSGLGLSIVSDLVESGGGVVKVESPAPGRVGSRGVLVRMTFPVA